MLDEVEIDFAYISSPNSFHADAIKECYKRGIHVICEKSLFINGQDYKKLIIQNKIKIFEAFMYRYHPVYKEVKKIIKDGHLGHINSMDVNFFIPHLNKENIRYSPDLGGGALYDLGAYTINTALSLFKNTKLKSCELFYEDSFDVDTSGEAIFECNQTKIHCKWGFGFEYQNNVILKTSANKIIINRFFSKDLREDNCHIEIEKLNSENSRVITLKNENHFINMFKSFVDDISNNDEFDNSAELNQLLKLQQIMDSRKNK
jgi:predicted dehydrogenase